MQMSESEKASYRKYFPYFDVHGKPGKCWFDLTDEEKEVRRQEERESLEAKERFESWERRLRDESMLYERGH